MNQFSSDFPWLPCRLFGEHGGICIPRADFKGSMFSLKSCPSESVKNNLVRWIFSDFWRFSLEKRDFYVILHNSNDGFRYMKQFSSDFPWFPCRLFREHGGICIPRVVFMDSMASLKCCPSEYVKKNSVWQFFSDFPSINGISML